MTTAYFMFTHRIHICKFLHPIADGMDMRSIQIWPKGKKVGEVKAVICMMCDLSVCAGSRKKRGEKKHNITQHNITTRR